MGTVLTFADLYRPEPIVLLSRWPKFVLLFNLDDDDVRLREQWDRVVDPADFVLAVSTNRGKDGETSWSARSHPDSPAPMFRMLPERPEGFSWFESEVFRRLKPGHVLHFSFPPNCLRQGIGMMLHSYNNNQDGEPVQGPFGKPSLENLPKELRVMLLGKLPVHEVFHVLPFVSSTMFNVAKQGGDWKCGDFGKTSFPSVRDVQLFVALASKTCTSVKLDGVRLDNEMDPAWGCLADVYSTLLCKAQWTSVTELYLVGGLHGFDPYALKAGIRKGNLPALEVLKLSSHKGLSWQALEGCSMPNLKKLDFLLGSSEPSLKNEQMLCLQFPGLEELIIEVEIDLRDASSWPPNLLFPRPPEEVQFLPCLKSLTIIGSPAEDEQSYKEALQVFSRTEVARLGLQGVHSSCSITGGWLFSAFQHLSVLQLPYHARFGWKSVPEDSLKKLVHLDVPLFEPNETTDIPFDKMVNLEAARVHVQFDMQSNFTSLKKLMKLPKLVTLCLEGTVSDVSLLMPDKGSVCNIRALDIEYLAIWDDKPNVGLQLCKSLPKLIRLVPPACQWSESEDELWALGRSHRAIGEFGKLAYLRIRISDMDTLEEDTTFFPDLSWEALVSSDHDYSNGNVYGSKLCVIRSRSLKKPLGRELFVFDDAFFSHSLD